MKIDPVSFNSPQKTFCHVARQIDLSQSPSDSSPSFFRASKIDGKISSEINVELNRNIFLSASALTRFQNHLQTYFQKLPRDLSMRSEVLSKKFVEATKRYLSGDAQTTLVENVALNEYHS